jgi:hypothetical protein
LLLGINSQAQKKNDTKTYAEISVKEGGKWEGRKYGGTLKNVEKLKLARNIHDHSFDIRYEGPGWEKQQNWIPIVSGLEKCYYFWKKPKRSFFRKLVRMVLIPTTK